MASEGPLSASVFASIDRVGAGDRDWASPANAGASDNLYASASLTGFGSHVIGTDWLKATGFGFAIPASATITGIVVEVELSNGLGLSGGATPQGHDAVRLVKGGTIQGDTRGAWAPWDSTDVYRTYGHPNDLWGLSWTPTDINNANFGVVVASTEWWNISLGWTARIDHIRITVYYIPSTDTQVPEGFRDYAVSGYWDSGDFNGGFPELLKDWSDIFVRLEEPLVTGQLVTVEARTEGSGLNSFTLVGSMSLGDTGRYFTLPTTHKQSKIIEVRVTLGGNASSSPVVDAVIIRYRPVPVQKRGWAFTVRAEQGLVFGDGAKETRTPEQIIDDLFALQTAGAITFKTMLEPTERSVYIQNAQLTSQLIGKDRPNPIEAEEGFVAVEVVGA